MEITKCIFHLPFVQCVGAIYQEVGNLVADIAPAINARLFRALGGEHQGSPRSSPPDFSNATQTEEHGRYSAVLYLAKTFEPPKNLKQARLEECLAWREVGKKELRGQIHKMMN